MTFKKNRINQETRGGVPVKVKAFADFAAAHIGGEVRAMLGGLDRAALR